MYHLHPQGRKISDSAYPAATRWVLARLFFDPEDEGDMFLRNVGSHMQLCLLYKQKQAHIRVNYLSTVSARQPQKPHPMNKISGAVTLSLPCTLHVVRAFTGQPRTPQPMNRDHRQCNCPWNVDRTRPSTHSATKTHLLLTITNNRKPTATKLHLTCTYRTFFLNPHHICHFCVLTFSKLVWGLGAMAYGGAVEFNFFFCSRTSRCNFSSALYNSNYTI
jgi:hypothetical protein